MRNIRILTHDEIQTLAEATLGYMEDLLRTHLEENLTHEELFLAVTSVLDAANGIAEEEHIRNCQCEHGPLDDSDEDDAQNPIFLN